MDKQDGQDGRGTSLAGANSASRSRFTICRLERASGTRSSTVSSRSSQNWRAKPLVSYRVIVDLIAATTTDTGLKVLCELDENCYPKGVAVSDAEMATLNIQREDFHGEWNYTISPTKGSKEAVIS